MDEELILSFDEYVKISSLLYTDMGDKIDGLYFVRSDGLTDSFLLFGNIEIIDIIKSLVENT